MTNGLEFWICLIMESYPYAMLVGTILIIIARIIGGKRK